MNIDLGKFDIVARFVVGLGAVAGGAYMAFAQGNVMDWHLVLLAGY